MSIRKQYKHILSRELGEKFAEKFEPFLFKHTSSEDEYIQKGIDIIGFIKKHIDNKKTVKELIKEIRDNVDIFDSLIMKDLLTTENEMFREIAQGPKINKDTKGIFKCTKCGKSETIFYQMQTRSADEGMSTFITCCNCGRRWREN